MSTVSTLSPSKGGKTLELQSLIREFQNKLGNNWNKYHESLSLFLVGKLSRNELVETISPLLKNGLVNYHNKLLMMNLANSLKESSNDYQNEFASFWNKRAIKTKNVKSSQYEKFKQNIMGLPIKERRRIKNITRDSGKKNKLFASITLTRHALLPKIPMIQDKEQQQLQVNNLVQWQQDVVNGINTPIATQNYELPDYDSLSRRILFSMRDNGLTGGVNAQVLEVVSLGLETHLNNVIESAIDVARYREKKYTSNDFIAVQSNQDGPKKRPLSEEERPSKKQKVVLNISDLYDTFEMYPHLLEYSGPKYRLPNVMLHNDDWDPSQPDYDLPPKLEVLKESEDKKDTIKKPEPNEMKTDDIASVKVLDNSPKDAIQNLQENTDSKSQRKPESHIGTTNELKWTLHDLITTM